MIKLGYLDGYNKFNEISFNSIEEQQEYFDNLVDITIDAYYPPHYTNIIKLDINEVPQASRINFVILEYREKYYYYFIDSIRYVNEDTYEILISMDTIQTYAFDFTIKKGVVIRESINRWNNNKINRNYIPENISEGEFINTHYSKFSNKYFIQVLSTSDYPVDEDYKYTNPKTYEPTRMISSPDGITGIMFAYNYLFYKPSIELKNSIFIEIRYNGVFHRAKTFTLNQFMAFFQEHYNRDSTKNIRLINCDYMKFINITEYNLANTTYIVFDIDTSYCIIDLGELFYLHIADNSPILFVISQSTKLYNIQYSAYINNELFSKNNELYKSFNIKYIPQLLDENYMSVVYGEKAKLTQTPLRMYDTVYFNFKSYFDFQSGSRGYACFDEYDKYNTFVQALYGNDFVLFNSYWVNYEATHKSSLTDGYALAQTNNALNFMKGTLGSYSNSTYNISTSSSGATQSMNTQYGYYQDFNTSYSGSKNFTQNIVGYNPISATTNAISFGQNMYNTYKEREILKADLKASPDAMSGLTEIIMSYATDSIENIYAIYQVRDIEACARYFEYNGYKVHRIINGNYRYNQICNNRYYYNVIKLQDIDISISSLIPNDIIGDIKQRLLNGIRIFKNSLSSILEVLEYDNVENDNL